MNTHRTRISRELAAQYGEEAVEIIQDGAAARPVRRDPARDVGADPQGARCRRAPRA